MKNLIYILIFLPNLLFSQETKNMEFVGVRNITVNSDNPVIDFQIQEGIIYKVLSLSHNRGGSPGSSNYDTYPQLKLNGETVFIFSTNSSIDYQTDFPFYLTEGEHSIEVNTYQSNFISGTLYGLEFKLTTP